MKVLVTGGTGLLGDGLIKVLPESVLLSRSAGNGRLQYDPESADSYPDCSDFDGVVHLAGESVAAGRWTRQRKATIERSRVVGTRNLVAAMTKSATPPRVLISASAVGFYGDRGDEWLAEDEPAGGDFLASVCRQWEAEAQVAEEAGIRVVRLRFGLVLSPHGGALAKMLPLFRLGAGGRLGSGRQWWPWVHIDDVVAAITFALSNEEVTGAVNVASPNPTTNAEFTRILGDLLGRPTLLPVPSFALRAALGQMAEMTLVSQRVAPQALTRAGFSFKFDRLEPALRDLLG